MTCDTINDAVTMVGGGGTLLAGRYRVVRQLGQGGMGSVWLAEDTQLDAKQFAIKMLPSILVSNKRAYRQLKDEALVAMQLVHPNIVQIRAFEENNGNPFLVMDYVDGETLDDYLAEKGGSNLTQSRREAESQRNLEDGCFGCGIPEEDVIGILKPIAAALDYAHKKGVVHRDVKPGNVMIAKDGTPFILDFGIAREIQETMTRVTGKPSSGTLLYMSPEQLHGAVPKKGQDIYSFAAMAYECLSGRPPFSRGQIEYQIDNDMPEPLAGVGVPLARSVMAGLAKKPEDRPATCLGVLAGGGFQRGAAGRRALTPCAPSQEKDSGRIRLHRGFGGQDEREGRKGIGWVLVVFALLAVLGGGYYFWATHEEALKQRAAEHARIVAERKAEAERIAREEAERWAKEESARKAAQERKVAEESKRKKEQEEQLARQIKAEEERRAKAEAKRLEEEKKSRERELAKQKEEDARKAAEAERAAIAAREKAESARTKALQGAALEILMKDPCQYDTVLMNLQDVQREVFGPLYDQLLLDKAKVDSLRKIYTEVNPKMVEARLAYKMSLKLVQCAASVFRAWNGLATADDASRDVLDVLLEVPCKYATVLERLSETHRKTLEPLYREMVVGEAKTLQLLGVYTENHPDVIAAREAQAKRIDAFKTLVAALAGKGGAARHSTKQTSSEKMVWVSAAEKEVVDRKSQAWAERCEREMQNLHANHGQVQAGSKVKDYYDNAMQWMKLGTHNRWRVEDMYKKGRMIGGPVVPEIEEWLRKWK